MNKVQAASTTMETAIPITETQAVEVDEFHTAGVVTMSAGHAMHDTYSGFLRPLLPTFIETLALTNAQAGLLTVFMQWPSLFQPFLGYVADKVSLRPFFIMAPTVTAGAMSLLGIAPTYAVLAMLLVVAGVSSASLHAAGPAIVGHLSGKKLGRGMGFWMVGGELGRTLGPLTAVTTVQLIGLKGTPWLMIAGPVTSLLLFFQLRNVPGSVAAGNGSAIGPSDWHRRGALVLGCFAVDVSAYPIDRTGGQPLVGGCISDRF
jgi:FSR family fosmidomycin resistance protein-like MFS transporter